MNRLAVAVLVAAVLGLQGALARDKTNLPAGKADEGLRVDPAFLEALKNGSLDGSLSGALPHVEAAGAVFANIGNISANVSAAPNDTKAADGRTPEDEGFHGPLSLPRGPSISKMVGPANGSKALGTLVASDDPDDLPFASLPVDPAAPEKVVFDSRPAPGNTTNSNTGANSTAAAVLKHFDAGLLAHGYRFGPGFEPRPSANRSNDPDVIAIREIASAVLGGPGEYAVVMTEVVLRSVLPDADNGTVPGGSELREVILHKFQDEDLMRRILESDANKAPAIPEQGPCVGCPQPHSEICALCWPVDFCRPLSSRVDIPCPAVPF